MTPQDTAIPSVAAAAPTTSGWPDRNVLSGGIVGLIAWGITFTAGRLGVAIPPDIQAGIPIVLGFIAAYVIPPSVKDIVDRLNNGIVQVAAAMPANPVSARTMVLPVNTKVVAASTPAPAVALPPALDPVVAAQAQKGI